MTKRIVLDLNLKYLVDALSLAQRGELLGALFNQFYHGNDETVSNVYQYLAALQDVYEKKRAHMQNISAKGVKARQLLSSHGDQTIDHAVKRKVTKEKRKNIYDKSYLNLFSSCSSSFLPSASPSLSLSPFVVPTIKDVETFVKENNLNVSAQTFVDFYEARGWLVGQTPIRSWQAMVRLWHERRLKSQANKDDGNNSADDENYWHQLADKFADNTSDKN